MLEGAVKHLDPLLDEVVFVGGVTVELWITDPASPPLRATADVDIIVEISTRRDYYRLEDRVRELGFENSQTSGVICRFSHSDSGLVLSLELSKGQKIRAIPPSFLMATKLEAFAGRGRADFYGSRDFEDIVRLIDGRPGLIDEIAAAPEMLRQYIAQQLSTLSRHPHFDGGLEGALPYGLAARERVEEAIWPRVRELIG